MIYPVYCYKDTKIGYLRPFVQENDNVALREFSDATNRPDFRYADDYELYRIADYDTKSGKITTEKDYPRFMCSYSSIQKKGDV